MRLNRVEKALMNNPLRSLVQWHYEEPLLEPLGGPVDGLRVTFDAAFEFGTLHHVPDCRPG